MAVLALVSIPFRTKKNIYNVLIGQVPLAGAVYETEITGLHICPSDNNLSGAEVELVNVIARGKVNLRALLKKKVQHLYDYILIDCPPSLGLLSLNALNAAKSFIVPLQTEYLAMEGLAQLINTVQLIRGSLNPELEMEGILLTMFDARASLHKQVAEDIRNHFGDIVFESVVPRNVKLGRVPSFGKPIILYDIDSKGSRAYLSLAKEVILERDIEPPQRERRFSAEKSTWKKFESSLVQ